ncbi:MAG: tRNA (adenosine(37)-N6)-threonylcarbamoyltransferase complex dimerization subunit type 1 TsaB [Bacilli bacterium]|nr:tRNA (adenosine(37)-N6)-threonylcarbamoyltransferase complex dimerization subunit type 1 TsaB [Bacilli bacterium]
MSYIVLLDSSNTSLSVGIAKESVLIDSISYEAWQEQSEKMIPELDKMLLNNEVNKDEITSVIVSIGPGSYTGVRIAITIAKVMATALKCEIKPVSSLRVLKENDKPSICLINARSNRSYIGVYQDDKVILEDQIMNNDEVKEYISSHPSYSVCGNVKYLDIDGYQANICEQMLLLNKSLTAIENPMALKPTYMKD